MREDLNSLYSYTREFKTLYLLNNNNTPSLGPSVIPDFDRLIFDCDSVKNN